MPRCAEGICRRLGPVGLVLFGVHARACAKHGTAKVPTPKVGSDLLDGTGIGRVAGHHPALNRDALAHDGQDPCALSTPGDRFEVADTAARPIRVEIGIVFVIG